MKPTTGKVKLPLFLCMEDDLILFVNERQLFLCTRISGRYAPLILAPAEGSSLEPCTLDYLNIKSFNYAFI